MSGLTSNTDHTCTITASNMYGKIKNFRAKKIFKTLEGPPSKPTNINVTGTTGFTPGSFLCTSRPSIVFRDAGKRRIFLEF